MDDTHRLASEARQLATELATRDVWLASWAVLRDVLFEAPLMNQFECARDLPVQADLTQCFVK